MAILVERLRIKTISYFNYIGLNSSCEDEIFHFHIFRSSHERCSLRKGVLRNFTKFTGKHLHQSLFLNKFAGL